MCSEVCAWRAVSFACLSAVLYLEATFLHLEENLTVLGGKSSCTWRPYFLFLGTDPPGLGSRPSVSGGQSYTWRPTTCATLLIFQVIPHVFGGRPFYPWRPTVLYLETKASMGALRVWRQDPSGSCIVCVPACLFLFFYCYIRTTHAFVSLNSAH